MSLPENIRNYREKAGMNQTELAKAVDVDPSSICKLEKGRFLPTFALVDAIADVLDVSLDELAHGDAADQEGA